MRMEGSHEDGGWRARQGKFSGDQTNGRDQGSDLTAVQEIREWTPPQVIIG